MGMRRIVACPALQYFSTLSHNGEMAEKKKNLLNVKCMFRFSIQLLSQGFSTLRRSERDIFKNIC